MAAAFADLECRNLGRHKKRLLKRAAKIFAFYEQLERHREYSPQDAQLRTQALRVLKQWIEELLEELHRSPPTGAR